MGMKVSINLLCMRICLVKEECVVIDTSFFRIFIYLACFSIVIPCHSLPNLAVIYALPPYKVG